MAKSWYVDLYTQGTSWVLTGYGVVDSSVFPVVWIGSLSGVDDTGRQVFRDADLEGRLHELRRVVIVIQHGAQHCGRARHGPRAAVTGLDCKQEAKEN